MSLVYDLRTTLVFALAAASQLGLGLLFHADPAFSDFWLLPFSVGGVLSVLLLDGVQRRWRGDPRTREEEPDARTLASTAVGVAALVLIGLWSYWQGHRALTWGLLVASGLAGAALIGRELYRLEE